MTVRDDPREDTMTVVTTRRPSAGPAIVLSLLAILLALVLAACGSSEIAASPTPSATPPSSGTTPASTGESPAIRVAEVLQPSVVAVIVADAQGQELGSGSGVIYRANGIIVTNNHVVTADGDQPAPGIAVTLATGETLDATLIGRDPLSDLAVLRIAGNDFPAATFLTDMTALQVGEYAFALGAPLGLRGSVTMGIVSAINREVPASGSLGTVDLIQTDAAISPGNSGGALADAEARVIGINVAAADVQTRAQNIGFAIPADTVVNVVDQILENGKVSYGYLGVQTTTITTSLQQQYDLSRAQGALVVQVEPGSPAAEAGVKQGDIIVQIGDRPVDTEVDLFAYLRSRRPGEKVDVVVDREGEEQTFTVTLGERPAG
jgi:serine protease DegQ